jgi:hypothetical protein
VCRRKELIKAFDFVLDLGLRDPYLIEYAVCDFLFGQGLHVTVKRPHYIRLANQMMRVVDMDPDFLPRNYLSRTWFRDAEALDTVLAQRFGYDLTTIPTNALRWALLLSIPSTRPVFWQQIIVYLRLIASSLTFLPFPLFARIARRGIRI